MLIALDLYADTNIYTMTYVYIHTYMQKEIEMVLVS